MTSGKHSGGGTSPFSKPQRSVYILLCAEGSLLLILLNSVLEAMNPAAPWLCISVVTQRWDRWWKNMSFPCFRRPVFQAEDGWVGSLGRPLSSSPYKPAHCMRDDLPQKPPIYHSAVSLQIPQGFSQSPPQSQPRQILGCRQVEAGARTLLMATQSTWFLVKHLLHTCAAHFLIAGYQHPNHSPKKTARQETNSTQGSMKAMGKEENTNEWLLG